jgi:murein L,D-transpeptidase YcbB/YkuD
MWRMLKPCATLLALLLTLPLAAAEPPPPAPEPASPQLLRHYLLLEQALVNYQELASRPELTRLPPLPRRSLQPGEPYAGAVELRVLLTALGDLPIPRELEGPPDILDETLVAALKNFQQRHGLTPDGVLGQGTWRALTTPLASRVKQIERTLARWRSLPPNPHRRAIFVNIPRFRLYAVDGMQEREADWLQLDVVVGKAIEQLRTPTFSADMTYVVFRPYWEVPRSIAVKEMLPAARRDAGYFERHNYEVVDGSGRLVTSPGARLEGLASGTMRVRQRPGESNSLGTVKFMLPNPHNVYLHDTPAKTLFSQVSRAYSHGCIRVSDPAALARWVFRDDAQWPPERIAAAMQGTQTMTVNLTEPIRVYIVYGTAIAREDGNVLFLPDLYNLDRD